MPIHLMPGGVKLDTEKARFLFKIADGNFQNSYYQSVNSGAYAKVSHYINSDGTSTYNGTMPMTENDVKNDLCLHDRADLYITHFGEPTDF